MTNETQNLADDTTVEPSVAHSKMTTYVKPRPPVINSPGLVNIAGDKGYFNGCRLVVFTDFEPPIGLMDGYRDKLLEALTPEGDEPWWPTAVEQINGLFEEFANLSIVDWRLMGKDIGVILTTNYTPEDLEDLQFVASVTEAEMRKRREARAAAKEEEEKKKAADRHEELALIEIGKKAKDHNLFGKLRDLEMKVKVMELNATKKG